MDELPIERSEVQISLQGRKLCRDCCSTSALSNTAMMSTPTAYCRWEYGAEREKTRHLLSYAKAKKMKSLRLRIHRVSVRDCSYFSSSFSFHLSSFLSSSDSSSCSGVRRELGFKARCHNDSTE